MCEERDVKWDAIEKEMEQLVLVRVIFQNITCMCTAMCTWYDCRILQTVHCNIDTLKKSVMGRRLHLARCRMPGPGPGGQILYEVPIFLFLVSRRGSYRNGSER